MSRESHHALMEFSRRSSHNAAVDIAGDFVHVEIVDSFPLAT
jgi:hypothetical protein